MKLKFITLNIWHGKLLDEVIAFLRAENADIVALQEVHEDSDPGLPAQFRAYTVMQEKLGYAHAAYAPAFKELRREGHIERGNAIFSHFPITNTDNIFFDVPYDAAYRPTKGKYEYEPRNLQHVVLDAGGREVNIFNTHGIWGTHGNDTDRRLAMCDTIIKEIKNKQRVMLAGDFNFFRHTGGIGRIEKNLHNVFGDELKTSFNLKHKTWGNFATSVVDMMFVSKDVKVTKYYCPPVDVSDHLPLVGVFAI